MYIYVYGLTVYSLLDIYNVTFNCFSICADKKTFHIVEIKSEN